jgi:hypothetical protein
MRPDARAFELAPATAAGVRHGGRVVLLDDTYVSGARAQSAAAALRLAGAAAVIIVPVGRVLRPGRSALHAAFLETQRTDDPASARPDDTCARCVQAPAPASASAPAPTE